MRIFYLLFIFAPLTSFGQGNFSNQQHQADQMVVYFLGNEIFLKHVTHNPGEVLLHGAHRFKYNFQHPKFSGETFTITFTLDSLGKFVPGKDTYGLFRIPSPNDSSWVTRQQVLKICKEQGKIKKGSLRLTWDSTGVSYVTFEKTHDFRDIEPGYLVWQVDGKVLFRGDWYRGTFEVDALTGRLARRFAIPWD